MAVSLQGNMAYYLEASEFLQQDNPAVRGKVRVRGNVVPDTLVKHAGELGAEFEITDGTHTMQVRYVTEVPDALVDPAEVVVEGEMGTDRVFVASTLLARFWEDWRGSPEALLAAFEPLHTHITAHQHQLRTQGQWGHSLP